MTTQDPEVDAYLERAERWQGEMRALRKILVGCGLEEAIKWGKPCFMFQGRNLAILQPFQKHCALMFFKGALLEDTHGQLRSQGPNSRAARRLEFTSQSAIRASVVKAYVKQAIAAETAGCEVDLQAAPEPEMPAELVRALKADRKLAKAFHALTPGRQRGYILHVQGARRAGTRAARIERCAPRILAGKGMHDR